jgi:gliding motility-associated-like protein
LVTTDYVLTVTASNGCDDTDTVRVTVTPTPVPNLPDSLVLCEGNEVWLSATPGFDSYLWSTGETSPSIQVSPTSTTTWWVMAWENGCPSRPDSVVVVVDAALPVADFSMSMDSGYIPVTVDFTNLSTNSTSYLWIFGMAGTSTEENPSFTFTQANDFGIWLIAYNDNNCPDTAYKSFRALDYTLFVPNVFSNNGDGLNDYFQVHYTGIDQFHVRIYDRWGMMVFESFDKDFKWDGFLHAEIVQEGVYTWVIDATSVKGNKINVAGNVTLMR